MGNDLTTKGTDCTNTFIGIVIFVFYVLFVANKNISGNVPDLMHLPDNADILQLLSGQGLVFADRLHFRGIRPFGRLEYQNQLFDISSIP